MADTTQTKKNIANAFFELMEKKAFSSVTIGNICDGCKINRRSFYYHFYDKFDLVEWIFKTDFLAAAQNREYDDMFDFLFDLCVYLDTNRKFYRKIFSIDADNPFYRYFCRMLEGIIRRKSDNSDEECAIFISSFFSDSIACAIRKWILNDYKYAPDEFVSLLGECVYGMRNRKVV